MCRERGREGGQYEVLGLCCLMTPGLSKDIQCHVWDSMRKLMQVVNRVLHIHLIYCILYYLCQGDYVFGSICLFVCLSVRLFVSNITKNVVNRLQWNYGGACGGKWLDYGSNPIHGLALTKVCALHELGILWLSVDIWGWRSITRWLSEWIRRLFFFYVSSLNDKNKILQSQWPYGFDGGLHSPSASCFTC